MSKPRLRVGSVLEILLSDNRKTYGRYLFRDPEYGQILQVFDHFLSKDETLNLSALAKANDLFPPIFVGISGAVRADYWKIVGYLPVIDFKYPGFIAGNWYGNPPIVNQWFFWDGSQLTRIGPKLPEEYKKYEFMTGYAAPDIAERIETGGESFVKELIRSDERKK